VPAVSAQPPQAAPKPPSSTGETTAFKHPSPITRDQFTPPQAGEQTKPPKKRRITALPRFLGKHKKLLLKGGLAVVVILIAAAAIISLSRWQAARNNPDTALLDSLQANLSVTKLEATTTGLAQRQVSYDFSDSKNPITNSVSSDRLSGAAVELKGYGSAKNTYVSYSKLPASTTPAITSQVQAGWVQLRANGTQPPGVSTILARAADPRSQVIGPVVFANLPASVSRQLAQYMLDHKVYSYSPSDVTKSSLQGKSVLVYSVKPNLGHLKIANQSAAANMGFTPGDVQAAVDALDAYKGATMKLYIDKSTHRVVRADIVQSGGSTTITYATENVPPLPNEPQTKLGWAGFAALQMQIEAQASAKQPITAQDTARKADLATLHTYLSRYFTQNNFYPTLTELNDQAWVATHFSGIDPDTLREPKATNTTLSPLPKAGLYSYQALSTEAKAGCDNTGPNLCAHFKLTSLLSSGQPYVVTDP
jgi:hypothetical protein